MGGYNRGRWNLHSKKIQVEECVKLTIFFLKLYLLFGNWQAVQWTRRGQQTGSICYRVIGNEHPTCLRLSYTIGAKSGHPEDFDYLVNLTTTPLPWIFAWRFPPSHPARPRPKVVTPKQRLFWRQADLTGEGYYIGCKIGRGHAGVTTKLIDLIAGGLHQNGGSGRSIAAFSTNGWLEQTEATPHGSLSFWLRTISSRNSIDILHRFFQCCLSGGTSSGAR